MQCIEVKLGTHVYLSVSMTTIDIRLPQAIFPITTSLLKLANHAMHGGESRYTCVFQCFHNNKQKWPQALFPLTTSSLLKLANHSGEICAQWYLSVYMMMRTSLRYSNLTYKYFHRGLSPLNDLSVYKNEKRHVNKKILRILKKGHIGMV